MMGIALAGSKTMEAVADSTGPSEKSALQTAQIVSAAQMGVLLVAVVLALKGFVFVMFAENVRGKLNALLVMVEEVEVHFHRYCSLRHHHCHPSRRVDRRSRAVPQKRG